MKDLEGTLIAQALSRPVVQRQDIGLQLHGGNKRQVTTFGQILSQQTVGVLIGAALPCMIRMREEYLHRKPAFEFSRTSKFTAVVQRKAVAFGGRQFADSLL